MTTFVLFDLDNMVVDSVYLKPFRDARRWSSVYSRVDAITVFPGVAEVWADLRALDLFLGVVTHSPRPGVFAGWSSNPTLTPEECAQGGWRYAAHLSDILQWVRT